MRGVQQQVDTSLRDEVPPVPMLELFNRMLVESPIAFLAYDPTGQCIVASVAAAQLAGGTQADILRQNYREVERFRTFGILDLVERTLTSGIAQRQEFHYISTFGKELWLELRTSRLLVGDKPYLLVILDDLSVQRKAQEELAKQQAHQEEVIQERTRALAEANHLLCEEIAERKRVEARIRYQATLLQNVSDAVIGTDLSFCITEWNRAAETLYGWCADEVMGKQVGEVLQTEYTSSTKAEALQAYQNHHSWHGEVTQRHRDGHLVRALGAVTAVFDDHGQQIGAVAVNRDIRAEKHTEDQLRTLSSAIHQSPVSIMITDNKGAIEYANPKFTQITGYTLDEIKGQNPRILKSGQTSAEEYRRLWTTITAGGQWQGELHNRAKDGTLFWESATISPIFDANSKISHFIAIKEDITERKQREREQNGMLALAMALRGINTREEMLTAILEQCALMLDAPIATLATYNGTSGQLTIEALHREGEPHYALDLELTVDDELTAVVLHLGKALWVDDVLEDSRIPMRDFVTTERALGCVPLITHGETLGVVSIMRATPFSSSERRLLTAAADMSAIALQRAQLHEQVKRYTADLEQEVAARTRQLAKANERLLELDSLKSKFVSDVTHELRTPVTNIGLYLSLIERKPDKLQAYLPVLTSQVERLQSLVKDTLDLSRMDQNRTVLQLAPVDLNAVAQSIITAHQARADELGLTLSASLTPNIPAVTGDEARIAQVITNLVANALNYTSQGSVTLRTYINSEQQQVVCEVVDTGCGIHPEDLAHLFERFYRGRREQLPLVPGSGLGLSIAKEIVDLHSGKIDVVSKINCGSTFRVALPLPHRAVSA